MRLSAVTDPGRDALRIVRDGGQATLEFVLVLPFIVLMLLATIQITMIGLDRIAVQNAARSAAREAAVTGDEDRIRDAATGAIPGDPRDVDVVVVGDRQVGESIEVRVVYDATPKVPLVRALFPRNVTLGASIAMRVEEP